MNRILPSRMSLAAAIVFGTLFSTDTEAGVARQIEKKANGADLFMSGLLNPFPAVFLAGRDGDIMVLAWADLSDFETARIKRSIESPAAGLPKLSKEQAARLRSYYPEIKPGEVVVFFLTVDESLTREGAEEAAKSLKTARIGVEKATTSVTLAVLTAIK